MKSAKAIIVKGESVLLLHSGEKIKLPGGHLEKDETFEQALHREVFEETKLHVNVLADLGEWSTEDEHGEKLSGRSFLCAPIDDVVQLDGTEHDSYEWVPFSDVHEPLFPAWLSRVMRKAEKELKK